MGNSSLKKTVSGDENYNDVINSQLLVIRLISFSLSKCPIRDVRMSECIIIIELCYV